MSGIRIVRAEGSAYERGRTIGGALGPTIRRSVDFNLGWFARRGLGRADIEGRLKPLLAATERCVPDELAALQGMADGAGLALLDIVVPNACEELEPWIDDRSAGPIERCTAFAVVDEGRTLVGHDEQWLADEPGEIVVIVEVPDDPGEPAIVSPTVASWRPAVGWNTTGHAQAVMSLAARDDRPGIPRVLVSRRSLGAHDRADAILRATPQERSGGYGYIHAWRGGDAFLVETSATGVAVVDGAACHTNHYLDPRLASTGAGPSQGSLSRRSRAETLLAARRGASFEAVAGILSDHDAVPSAICLHPDPADGDDAEAILFSMVCDLEAGRMWVAPGRPCETPYEALDLAELIAG